MAEWNGLQVTQNGFDNLESDGNTSFLRAARNGQLEKVLEHLKTNIDINTSNANGLNALHLASKDGHVEIVEELLKRGAVVDAATKKGNTALHIASLAGQEEVVKLLVQHGASVNVQSQNGFTPLYMAAQENHDNVVKYLLANGANQSLSTEDGFTPLAVAMQQGHDKVVTVLLENDTRGKVRLPALHIAAKKDDVRAAKLLLENDHNPDVTSKSGFTPLHIASHYGNQSIANLLVQKGADVNYSAKHNITPLHVAAKWGKSNMVALLLEQGAHIEAKTRDGLTPLHCAARSGHEQVVDMLLEKSAPISSKTKNGLAPLHMAAQGDHVDAARILLYHRAPVDEVTVDYLTALHVAAHCGHVRVAKLLLDRQADANARALNGFTPLHIACKKNRIKVVELLLKHGACIGATTESGLTPLHVASFMGCMNIVIYLLQHDASPDIPTVRGETPLHLAARANQTDIIRILLRNGAQVDARAREQQTPLHIASRLGNVDIVMLLLQHGAKVDNTTKDMYTALHIAAKEGQDEVAAALIENGASLNATTKKGFTPLHLAAKYGHLKVAKLLVQKEAPVDAQGKNGVTPLHVASHYDHQNVALLLLDKGASPHANAKNGHTPLHIAARKNQMDIANTLLEYGALPDAESKAGFTPLHLSSQEGHTDITALLLEHKATPSHHSKNGLTPMHLCAQENRVSVAEILHENGADINAPTKGGYTPLHIACHFGQADMVKFLLSKGANVKNTTSIGYTPLHQAAQQGHTNIVNLLLDNSAEPNAITNNGQTPLHIAQKLGYISVIDTLKTVTEQTQTPTLSEEKYRVVAPEAMHETFLSDSEEEGEDTLLGDQTYRYLTADEMKSLGDDSLPIDVTRDERMDSNRMVGSDDLNSYPPRHIEDSISPEHIHPNYVEYIKKTPDNIDISRHPVNIGFLVSFLVDARGGAMRGCRHSGVRVIVPPRCAPSPTRITCRYVRPQRTPHPPPLMEGEALASRVLELGPVGAKFLGPVIIEVPHFAALRGKEREIVILRSDNGESWKEHTIEATEDVLTEVLRESFDPDDLNQLEDNSAGRITRIITQDFPQYFAVISRIRQEVHAIGPEGGMVSSTVVPQVQAVFPQGALTKKIKVGLQAQPIDPELTAKLLGHGVAVSPVVTVEPRRRKFHKAITLSMPAPRAHSQGMINQYSGSAPTLRLLCSITGGTSRAQWEDVTGSTPLTFVNDCVSFTTTVSARFWLMDCRNIGDATKMATELYREAIHVPFIAKFVVFAKRIDPLEARLRVFCMTDDKEEKTLEYQEQFTEIAKSRDVEVLEGKSQYIEFAGNLVPITKSGEQLQFSFRAFKENRLPFSVRVKDQHAEAVSRCLFMREPKVQKGEPPQQPICILNIVLPDDIVSDTISLTDSESIRKKFYANENFDYYRQDPRLADMSNLLGEDWVQLANQLGLTSSEINVIKSEYPDSVAKQAQSMLRMWLSQSGNRAQTNTLDNALRRIGREDIIHQCLNVDNRSQQILRLRPEEKGKPRLKDDILNEEISSQKKHYDENKRNDSDKYEKFDKYSAEEKVFEPSDEEEDFNKTVPERREQIVKRLSTERTIPASSQRVEIVQEISSIKRQSLVEDKIQEVQQKTNIEPLKIGTIKPVSKIIQEKKLETEVEVKAPHPSIDASNIKSDTSMDVPIFEVETTDRRDSVLLEEVTQLLESKKPLPKLITHGDPKSPKFSKTPPPSPADFAVRDKDATTIQEWEAPKEEHKDLSRDELIKTNVDAEGKTTSTQYLNNQREKSLDKTIDSSHISNIDRIKTETNAFLKSESEPEPITQSEESPPRFKELISQTSDEKETTVKKPKRGVLASLKSLVTKTKDDSDVSLNKNQKDEQENKISKENFSIVSTDNTDVESTVNPENTLGEIHDIEDNDRKSQEMKDNNLAKVISESEIIEKHDEETSEEHKSKSEGKKDRKKSGILGFLTKKSKKSSEETYIDSDSNKDDSLKSTISSEMTKTTEKFLNEEKQNYSDNLNDNEAREGSKHKNLSEIDGDDILLKLNLDMAKTQKYHSYVRFGDENLSYVTDDIKDGTNRITKKVSFEDNQPKLIGNGEVKQIILEDHPQKDEDIPKIPEEFLLKKTGDEKPIKFEVEASKTVTEAGTEKTLPFVHKTPSNNEKLMKQEDDGGESHSQQTTAIDSRKVIKITSKIVDNSELLVQEKLSCEDIEKHYFDENASESRDTNASKNSEILDDLKSDNLVIDTAKPKKSGKFNSFGRKKEPQNISNDAALEEAMQDSSEREKGERGISEESVLKDNEEQKDIDIKQLNKEPNIKTEENKKSNIETLIATEDRKLQMQSPKKKNIMGFLKRKSKNDDEIESQEDFRKNMGKIETEPSHHDPKGDLMPSEKDSLDRRNEEYHGRGKGILNFLSNRGKSKERNSEGIQHTESQDQEIPKCLDDSKSFLDKEIEMYHDMKIFSQKLEDSGKMQSSDIRSVEKEDEVKDDNYQAIEATDKKSETFASLKQHEKKTSFSKTLVEEKIEGGRGFFGFLSRRSKSKERDGTDSDATNSQDQGISNQLDDTKSFLCKEREMYYDTKVPTKQQEGFEEVKMSTGKSAFGVDKMKDKDFESVEMNSKTSTDKTVIDDLSPPPKEKLTSPKPRTKEGREGGKGFFEFLSRRSKSKERDENDIGKMKSQDLDTSQRLDETKSFLDKEIEKYHDINIHSQPIGGYQKVQSSEQRTVDEAYDRRDIDCEVVQPSNTTDQIITRDPSSSPKKKLSFPKAGMEVEREGGRGLFGFLSKRSKSKERDGNVDDKTKLPHPEISKRLDDTKAFIETEKKMYYDMRINPQQLEDFNTIHIPPEETLAGVDTIRSVDSEVFEAIKTKSNVQIPDLSSPQKKERSSSNPDFEEGRESWKGLFGFSNKRIESKEIEGNDANVDELQDREISKPSDDTKSFLDKEKEMYHDIKFYSQDLKDLATIQNSKEEAVDGVDRTQAKNNTSMNTMVTNDLSPKQKEEPSSSKPPAEQEIDGGRRFFGFLSRRSKSKDRDGDNDEKISEKKSSQKVSELTMYQDVENFQEVENKNPVEVMNTERVCDPINKNLVKEDGPKADQELEALSSKKNRKEKGVFKFLRIKTKDKEDIKTKGMEREVAVKGIEDSREFLNKEKVVYHDVEVAIEPQTIEIFTDNKDAQNLVQVEINPKEKNKKNSVLKKIKSDNLRGHEMDSCKSVQEKSLPNPEKLNVASSSSSEKQQDDFQYGLDDALPREEFLENIQEDAMKKTIEKGEIDVENVSFSEKIEKTREFLNEEIVRYDDIKPSSPKGKAPCESIEESQVHEQLTKADVKTAADNSYSDAGQKEKSSRSFMSFFNIRGKSKDREESAVKKKETPDKQNEKLIRDNIFSREMSPQTPENHLNENIASYSKSTGENKSMDNMNNNDKEFSIEKIDGGFPKDVSIIDEEVNVQDNMTIDGETEELLKSSSTHVIILDEESLPRDQKEKKTVVEAHVEHISSPTEDQEDIKELDPRKDSEIMTSKQGLLFKTETEEKMQQTEDYKKQSDTSFLRFLKGQSKEQGDKIQEEVKQETPAIAGQEIVDNTKRFLLQETERYDIGDSISTTLSAEDTLKKSPDKSKSSDQKSAYSKTDTVLIEKKYDELTENIKHLSNSDDNDKTQSNAKQSNDEKKQSGKGFLKFFRGKSKEREENSRIISEGERKANEGTLKERVDATRQFLEREVELYNDIRPIISSEESLVGHELKQTINQPQDSSLKDEKQNELQHLTKSETTKNKKSTGDPIKSGTKKFFGLFSGRSKSKERTSIMDERVVKDIDDTKKFLLKEIKMYYSNPPNIRMEPLSDESSIYENVVKEEKKTDKPKKKSKGLLNIFKRKSKDENKLGDETAEIEIKVSKQTDQKASEIIANTSDFLKREIDLYQDVKLITEDLLNPEVDELLNVQLCPQEYTAFDFIQEEVDNFEKTRLPSTKTIDTSFRVETEVEEIEGEHPKEIIRKKIIISEKLLHDPNLRENVGSISGDILKELMLISNQLEDQVEQQNLETMSTCGPKESIKDEDMTVNRNKRGSQEKIEEVTGEFAEAMRDLELVKGDIVEDVSLFESNMKRFSEHSPDKITDLDDYSSEIIMNASTRAKDEVSSSIQRVPNDNDNYLGGKDTIIEINKNMIRALSDNSVGENMFETNNNRRKISETNVDISEIRSDLEELAQERDSSMSSQSCISPYVTSPSSVRRALSQKGMKYDRPHAVELNDNEEITTSESSYIVSEPGETYFERNSSKDPKRSRIFRIESEEDDSNTDTSRRDEIDVKTSPEFLKDLKLEKSVLIHAPEKRHTSDEPDEDENIKDSSSTDTKTDVEMIEEKLRDLGKALDVLEKIETTFDDPLSEKQERKLRRVERKFERMASEILEPAPDNEQAKKSPNSEENKQYQQMVSQLSADEVISCEADYSNLWEDYTFSKSDEWDSKTPDSQADVIELPQGDDSSKSSGSRDVSMLRDSSQLSMEGQARPPVDQHQLSEEMKELLKEMEESSK